MRRIHVIVSGRVQGVSYRASTAHEARRLGLVGWVKNLADGRVELEAEGPSDVVDQLLTWCHAGPPAAKVTNIVVTERPVTGTDREFAITFGG
jgi:acylphosphatase